MTFEAQALPATVLQAVMDHAAECAPRECCGLLVALEAGLHYLPAANLAAVDAARDSFVLDPQAWLIQDHGAEVLAVVHSHPYASANPSMADRIGCERSGLPWLIVGWPHQALVTVQPEGWQAPLLGREFSFGVLDCYTLVQDFYRRELHTELPDFERWDAFWEATPDRPAAHLYRDGLAAAGFSVVQDKPRSGDGLLMRVRSPNVDNHAAVYLGEGLMLHHLYGQPSRLERWDWPWQRRTTAVVRHHAFAAAAPTVRPALLAGEA